MRAAKLPEVVDGVKADFDEHDFAAGEDAAHQRLQQFVSRHLLSYEERRDFPALPGTSGISADLAVGALSPRQCLQLAAKSEPLRNTKISLRVFLSRSRKATEPASIVRKRSMSKTGLEATL